MLYAYAGLLGFLLFCYAIVDVLFHHCVTFYLKPVCTSLILFLNLKALHICKTYLSILLDSHNHLMELLQLFCSGILRNGVLHIV